MTTETSRQPKSYRGIMVSSTFTDLEEHRRKVIEAIQKSGHKANVMEYSGPQAEHDVISSSIEMVRDSVAYIGVISRKYGQTPFDSKLNPDRLSITELEFNEAIRLGRPILLFIMGANHPVVEADVELDPDKRKKLDAFRERAKRMREDSEVERVYAAFETLQQFATETATAVGNLARSLGDLEEESTPQEIGEVSEQGTSLPRPPALAALPRYLGSHPFVGRAAELQKLSDWGAPADPSPMLLFEAIGGSGKSMLTWEWLTKHATNARGDWAGRFWYSFYEKGAVMADSCRQALAYMTERPATDFLKLRTPQLADLLVAQLEKRPWLIVLDGLERVLVAYHRHDAAQLRDEEADTTSDQIGQRDPCTAIRPEDDDLLRRLTDVAPSKILISSRLTPLALINRSGTQIPRVRREMLAGLRPADAEVMIRNSGVTGNSKAIQAYLQTNCDCHPLVVGALAGLINDYPPDRGNFDRWAEDPHHGAALNLAALDLVQRRNHILLAAVGALTLEGRQLLQTLALLQAGAEFDTLTSFNPHLPPEPSKVEDPDKTTTLRSQSGRAAARDRYETTKAEWKTYVAALTAWEHDPAVQAAPKRLQETIRDLEKRGLLQYDANGKHYDLHPVVRGIVAGKMGGDETSTLGQRVVDHFTSQPHDPWEQAETLDDVAPGLQIVRVQLRMGLYQEAFEAYSGDLARALRFNLGADAELQALLKSFFPGGWDADPVAIRVLDQVYLLNEAGMTLGLRYPEQAPPLYNRAIVILIRESIHPPLMAVLSNLSSGSIRANKLAEAARLRALAFDMEEVRGAEQTTFIATLFLFALSILFGDQAITDRLWKALDGRGKDQDRAYYRLGDAEAWRALNLFYRGKLTENFLRRAERLARTGRNRQKVEELCQLRGRWHLSRDEPALAVAPLSEGIRMAREVGSEAHDSEALLALARHRVSEQFDARSEAEVLSGQTSELAVAELWHALGDTERAIEHARRTHEWAAGDGEPFVRRYVLDRSRELLTKLGAELPPVPRYDPSKAVLFHWENDIRKLIAKLRAKKKKQARPKLAKKKTKPHRKKASRLTPPPPRTSPRR